MRKKIIALLSVSLLSFMLPNLVFAGWFEDKITSVITYLLTLIFKPIFDTMIDALNGILVTPDLKNIQFVQTTMMCARYIGASLLITQVTFRIWKAQTSRLTTGQSEPIPDILFRALISAVMILGLPAILNYLIKLNALLIDGIASIGVNFQQGLKALAFPQTGGLIVTIIFVIWVISLIGLTVSNAVRLGELCFLYIIGPIIAVSHAGKGESFQIWIMQAVAVTFTQAVQFLMVGAALNFTANIDIAKWYTFLLPIGAVVVGIKGPQMLKQFLYSTGTAGAITGGAKSVASTAIYSKMMKR